MIETNKYSLKATLKKNKKMIFFSQINLIHILERALRRTDLDSYYTQGFRPHIKISLLTGLKLGVAGKINAIFYFSCATSPSHFKKSLSKELPPGLKITSVTAC